MASCLKDGTELGDEFGMATCPVCSTVYFIDADGEVSISSEPEDKQDSGFEPVEMDADFQIGEAIEVPEDDLKFDVPSYEPNDSPDEIPAEEPSDSFEPVNLGTSNFDLPLSSEPEGEAPPSAIAAEPVPVIDPADPLGIKDYIESEISQAKDGPLLFRVFVSGIDTKEIRQSLREAISDGRFGWDADEILSRVQKGELKLENVSPVKASVLITRIKRLPVHIRWEQYDIKDAQI